MKQKLPGILFLLAMPCSVFLYMKMEEWTGSEILGLLTAVLLYVVLALFMGLFFSRGESK